jgi:hypothetical protein
MVETHAEIVRLVVAFDQSGVGVSRRRDASTGEFVASAWESARPPDCRNEAPPYTGRHV